MNRQLHTPDALLYLDSALVVQLCAGLDPVALVTDAFLAVRTGRAAVAPEAALRWTAPDGTAARSLVLPARLGASRGCKVINACLGNPARGLPRAQGLILLFDEQTAAPVCVLDAAHISATRTAAVSVAALDAVRGTGRLRGVAFLGCGRLALAHAELFAARCPVETVMLHDVDPERAKAFAARMTGVFPGATVTVTPGARAAVAQADVTVACTTTTVPYIALPWLRPGSTLVNVSLDDATEDVLTGCDHLFVDDWELVAGDDTRLLGRLARAGRVTGPHRPCPPGARAVDAELPELLSGQYPRPVRATDRVVVNPFGMGVHDIALATEVYRLACDRGVGSWLPR